MARTSTGKDTTSTGKSPRGRDSKGGSRPKQEAATKGAIREAMLRKKDELLKLKSLDIFLIKDALGILPGTTDIKEELRNAIANLKKRRR